MRSLSVQAPSPKAKPRNVPRRGTATPEDSASALSERRPDFVDSLAKGLQLLAAFERNVSLGNGDLVQLTGLPKATVSRLTGTLVTLGYLQRDEETRRYMVGSRTLGMGASLQRHMRLQRSARPRMQQLADELDVSVILGTREGTQVLLLEVARPPRSRLTVNTDIGSHIPLENTAIGMSCLVAAPVRERVRLLDELQRCHAKDWGAVRERVERAHAERLRRRFIVAPRSGGSGIIASAAAPIILERGRVFAFAAVGPASEMPRERLFDLVGPALSAMVDRVAVDLGGTPADGTSPARVRGSATP